MWTDDLGLEQLLESLGVRVRFAWTQAVMRAALARARISQGTYEQVLGRLLDRGYAFTRLSAADMVAVLRDANWRIESGSGEALIRVVCDVALMNPHNRFITAMFLKGLWKECPCRESAKAIIVAVLDKIGRERSQTMLAAFIYRFRKLQGTWFDRKSWVMASSGAGVSNRTARHVRYAFDPFGDPEDRALKRFLRAWRSRDGECTPARGRGRRNT